MTATMFHYTNKSGFNAIRAQPTWLFKALKPPCENPVGAYFTNLDESTPLLARKLRIPREKLTYVFSFVNINDLTPIRGDRGRHIFYSPVDYNVAADRQGEARPTQCSNDGGEI